MWANLHNVLGVYIYIYVCVCMSVFVFISRSRVQYQGPQSVLTDISLKVGLEELTSTSRYLCLTMN